MIAFKFQNLILIQYIVIMDDYVIYVTVIKTQYVLPITNIFNIIQFFHATPPPSKKLVGSI